MVFVVKNEFTSSAPPPSATAQDEAEDRRERGANELPISRIDDRRSVGPNASLLRSKRAYCFLAQLLPAYRCVSRLREATARSALLASFHRLLK